MYNHCANNRQLDYSKSDTRGSREENALLDAFVGCAQNVLSPPGAQLNGQDLYDAIKGYLRDHISATIEVSFFFHLRERAQRTEELQSLLPNNLTETMRGGVAGGPSCGLRHGVESLHDRRAAAEPHLLLP